jgi:glycosyltransferase involved in cell wall biosynthesis
MQLSVLIPTYNDAPLLAETIAPLLRDPATGEVIVVVDGSRDGSYELLLEMSRRDGRVRPLWIENRGRAGARQCALERAQHDVVGLCSTGSRSSGVSQTGCVRCGADLRLLAGDRLR